MPRTTTLRGDERGVNGFTLIELLVVVLIIGILAAVALPKYEVAVLKTKYANLTLLAETYVKAAQAAQLATGTWPSSFDVLDVSLPGGSVETTPTASHCGQFKEYYCCLLSEYDGYQSNGVSCGLQDVRLGLVITVKATGQINSRNCYAKTTDNAANQVCKGLPYYETNNLNLPAPDGHITGMNGYFY